MPLNDGDERLERLIAAIESQANAVNRLVQVLEKKSKKEPRAPRLRKASVDRPLVVTPLVQAAVSRALAKARK